MISNSRVPASLENTAPNMSTTTVPYTPRQDQHYARFVMQLHEAPRKPNGKIVHGYTATKSRQLLANLNESGPCRDMFYSDSHPTLAGQLRDTDFWLLRVNTINDILVKLGRPEFCHGRFTSDHGARAERRIDSGSQLVRALMAEVYRHDLRQSRKAAAA
jgi:hypothetical protein